MTKSFSLIFLSSLSLFGGELAEGFKDPELKYHPRVWWHWMDGKVTKDGVTKDLEAMQRIGIKGAQIFNMGAHRAEQNGEELILSPSWNEVVKHAANESARLGLKLGISGGEGCSGSGGKWVTPEYSMQEIVWAETQVKGGQGTLTMPQPRITENWYKDVAVYAFPSIPVELKPLGTYAPEITSDIEGVDWNAAIDGNAETFASLPRVPQDKASYSVSFRFKEEIDVRSLTLDLFEEAEKRQVKIYKSPDGERWDMIGMAMHLRGHVPHGREVMIEGVTPQKTKHVKVEFLSTHHAQPAKLFSLSVQPYKVEDIHQKAARMRGGLAMSEQTRFPVPEEEIISSDSIIDLTSKMNEQGELSYDLPEGDWTLIRFGHTSKGNKSKPAAPQSAGLEVDKMSPEAIEFHFKNGMLGKMCEFLGENTGNSFNCVNFDSWEAGCQTWTKQFPERFTAHHGYDCKKWLITVTGRVVNSLDETDRFLWDYRRTVADLIIEGYYGTLKKLLNEKGVLLEAEAPGTGMPIIADGIKSLGALDIVQGEFWLGGEAHPIHGWKGGNDNTKEPACAAHVYGKEIVSCEAFTSFGHHDGWQQTPASLKPWADRQFCKGMNEIVFHCSAHQPDDRAPGQTLGQFGLNFHRHLTWWEQAKDWIDYFSRTQYMLRQGRFYADVLYFYGEDAPGSAGYFVPDALDPRKMMKPNLPLGYDYDVCDLTILEQVSVEGGEVVLPSGMRYKYLVLPDDKRYRPGALRKVLEIVQAGATVIGPKPERCPSLAGFPNADAEIKKLAEEIWGAGTEAERTVGKGRVITGKEFPEILAADQIVEDFSYRTTHEDAELTYIHRTLEDGEMYYISNRKDRAEEATLTFRTTGKRPELWNPVTGGRTELAMYSESGNQTTVSLHLDPYDAQFILFTQPSEGKLGITDFLHNGKRVRSIENAVEGAETIAPRIAVKEGKTELTAWKNGTYALLAPHGKELKAEVSTLPEPINLDSDWTVTFPAGKGAPTDPVNFQTLASWTENAVDGVKYFSGTATYSSTLVLDENYLKEGRRAVLDLGKVAHVAEVKVNGKDLGVYWQPPYLVDLTEVAKNGENTLEIKVTNNWKNRLIGDAKLPEDQRSSFSHYPFYKGDEELQESGLLGGVRLLAADKVTF